MTYIRRTHRNKTHSSEEEHQGFIAPGGFYDSYGVLPFNILIDNGFVVPAWKAMLVETSRSPAMAPTPHCLFPPPREAEVIKIFLFPFRVIYAFSRKCMRPTTIPPLLLTHMAV